MVRPVPIEIHASGQSFSSSSPIPLALGLFISATLLVALCAKHATRRHASKAKLPNKLYPDQPIATTSHEAKKQPEPDSARVNDEESAGVWQKAIMMGERCQPPEFSGVIYYDYCGNRIPEMPESPRATYMSPLRSFNYHVERNDNISMH